MRNYNHRNGWCCSCGGWVWKGDGHWARGKTTCQPCWVLQSAPTRVETGSARLLDTIVRPVVD